MANGKESSLEELLKSLIAYVKARLELFKLNAVEFGTNNISGFLRFLIVGTLIVITLLFLGFGFAFLLSEIFGSPYLGFLAVGGVFLLLAVFTAAFWNSVIKPKIMRFLLKMLPDDENQES